MQVRLWVIHVISSMHKRLPLFPQEPTFCCSTISVATGSLGISIPKAIEFIDKAIRLSPHDPGLFFWYTGKSVAYFALQQDDQAIEWARRAIAINPNYSPPNGILVAALALTGHEAEARDRLQRRNAVRPFKSIVAYKAENAPPPSADPRVHASFDRFIEGLRKAGLPEE